MCRNVKRDLAQCRLGICFVVSIEEAQIMCMHGNRPGGERLLTMMRSWCVEQREDLLAGSHAVHRHVEE